MSVDVTALVGGAVGGAAIQSVLGPLFGQVHDRRSLRAKALEGLAAVESARWATGEEDHDEFRSALKQLRSAALVAGVTRSLIDIYILAAAAGFRESRQQFEMAGGHPDSAGIDTRLADYVANCAEALSTYAWHPWWGRILRHHTLKNLNRQRSQVTDEMKADGLHIDWDQIWVPY